MHPNKKTRKGGNAKRRGGLQRGKKWAFLLPAGKGGRQNWEQSYRGGTKWPKGGKTKKRGKYFGITEKVVGGGNLTRKKKRSFHTAKKKKRRKKQKGLKVDCPRPIKKKSRLVGRGGGGGVSLKQPEKGGQRPEVEKINERGR